MFLLQAVSEENRQNFTVNVFPRQMGEYENFIKTKFAILKTKILAAFNLDEIFNSEEESPALRVLKETLNLNPSEEELLDLLETWSADEFSEIPKPIVWSQGLSETDSIDDPEEGQKSATGSDERFDSSGDTLKFPIDGDGTSDSSNF